MTMAKKAKPKSPLEDRWRITWMDQWDQDFVNEEVAGYFDFGLNNAGSFQFGYVPVKSTPARAFVIVSPLSSSHGKGTTRWMLFKSAAGPSLA